MKEIISKSNNKSQLHNRYEYEIVSVPHRVADLFEIADRDRQNPDRWVRVKNKSSGETSPPLTYSEAVKILKSTSVRGGAA